MGTPRRWWGGGPAGIAAALALQEAGVQVTIWEREQTLGGVMSWGIPQFVLPPVVLAELLDRVGRSGIQVRTGVEVGAEITLAELHRSHDLVFLGTGAPVPVALRVPGAETAGVVQAGDYLSAGSGARPAAREVIVLGGGNTAIDACRVALRSGAERVRLVYRRNRAAMPATATEIEFALTEGTELVELASPAAIMPSRDRLAVQCQVMTPSAPNYPGGRPNVVPTGELRTLEADLVVLALGYLNGPLPGLEVDDRRRIQVDRDHGTSLPRTYAGGDAVTGPATVVAAMAAGRDAGRIMARSLGLEAARG